MQQQSKQDLENDITSTYWLFWTFVIFTGMSIINFIFWQTFVTLSIIIINIYCCVDYYKKHKAKRVIYDRRYSWSIDSGSDKSEKSE